MPFSAGRTVQVLLRQQRQRYEVYINHRVFFPFYFVAPQGSAEEEKTHRAREMSDTETLTGLLRDPRGPRVRSVALSTHTNTQHGR